MGGVVESVVGGPGPARRPVEQGGDRGAHNKGRDQSLCGPSWSLTDDDELQGADAEEQGEAP